MFLPTRTKETAKADTKPTPAIPQPGFQDGPQTSPAVGLKLPIRSATGPSHLPILISEANPSIQTLETQDTIPSSPEDECSQDSTDYIPLEGNAENPQPGFMKLERRIPGRSLRTRVRRSRPIPGLSHDPLLGPSDASSGPAVDPDSCSALGSTALATGSDAGPSRCNLRRSRRLAKKAQSDAQQRLGADGSRDLTPEENVDTVSSLSKVVGGRVGKPLASKESRKKVKEYLTQKLAALPFIPTTPHDTTINNCRIVIRTAVQSVNFATALATKNPLSENRGFAAALGTRIVFYTDGSHKKRLAGGAAVSYTRCLPDPTDWIDAVAGVVGTLTSGETELIAIGLALNIARHEIMPYFRTAPARKDTWPTIIIVTDSQSSLGWIKDYLEGTSKKSNDKAIHKQLIFPLRKLEQLGAKIEFHWTKGHQTVSGNIRADMLAGQASDLTLELIKGKQDYWEHTSSYAVRMAIGTSMEVLGVFESHNEDIVSLLGGIPLVAGIHENASIQGPRPSQQQLREQMILTRLGCKENVVKTLWYKIKSPIEKLAQVVTNHKRKRKRKHEEYESSETVEPNKTKGLQPINSEARALPGVRKPLPDIPKALPDLPKTFSCQPKVTKDSLLPREKALPATLTVTVSPPTPKIRTYPGIPSVNSSPNKLKSQLDSFHGCISLDLSLPARPESELCLSPRAYEPPRNPTIPRQAVPSRVDPTPESNKENNTNNIRGANSNSAKKDDEGTNDKTGHSSGPANGPEIIDLTQDEPEIIDLTGL